MNSDTRAKVLAALREIYDGHWDRKVGAEGGRVLTWEGRIVVIGAVTTAWDTHHGSSPPWATGSCSSVSTPRKRRMAAGRQAIANTGDEKAMRTSCPTRSAGVIAGMSTEPITAHRRGDREAARAADLVTLARTGVEYDYRGNVIDAHAPEMPTRFAKQLTQIVRGAVAIGMDRADALRLADPLRARLHAAAAAGHHRRPVSDPYATPTEVSASGSRSRAPPSTANFRRCTSSGVVELDQPQNKWHYSLASDVDPDALKPP